MLGFIIYAALCVVAERYNTYVDEKRVCRVCFYVLIVGMLIDPVVQMLPTLEAHALVCLLNLAGLVSLPYVHKYRYIRVLFLIGIWLCAVSAVSHWYKLSLDVPYVAITHILNLMQTFILLGGSNGFIDKFRRGQRHANTNRTSDEYYLRNH